MKEKVHTCCLQKLISDFLKNKIIRELIVKNSTSLNQHPYLSLILFCLVPGSLLSYLPVTKQFVAGYVCVLCCAFLILLLAINAIRHNHSENRTILILFGIAYFLRLSFVLRTEYMDMQHDVYEFGSLHSHSGYILFFLTEHKLPDFDVRNVWQFYHPPLHYILSAALMQVLMWFGMPTELTYEAIQMLPFTYSCLILVSFYRLLKHFNIKKRSVFFLTSIMALHPFFIMLSGFINNDALSILFTINSLLLVCQWYREPKLSTIIKLGFAIGLGMETKLSVWMIAPSIMVAFLATLIKGKNLFKKIKQYVIFACISFPLGLWWSIRNYIKYQVPIGFVPIPPKTYQYVGDIPVTRRIIDFSLEQFSCVYQCAVNRGDSYNEYNPIISLLKTSMFDEFVNSNSFPHVTGFGEMLFWTNVILSLFSAIAIIVVLVKNLIPDGTEKWILLLGYIINFICYLVFCIGYPSTCTENIRYASPLIYISLIFSGILFSKKKLKIEKIEKVFYYFSALFCCTSLLIYGVLIYA